jgi:lipoate-protein ligase B
MKNLIQVYNLGRLNYPKALKIQKYFVNKHLENSNLSQDTLLLVEHDPVYTVGLRRSLYKENDLEKLKSLGAAVEITNRGCLITFHGPGQLVAYPILNLKNYTASIKWYVSQLESIIVNLCLNSYNLNANRLCKLGYTGVWVNDTKLAAVGIHCSRYITYHGIALNCNVDLNWFNHIVPCGIEDKKVTSLSKLMNKQITINDVVPDFMKEFQKLFQANIEMKSKEETGDLIEKVG